MDRLSFIAHKGKPILLLDFRGASGAEMLPLMDEIKRLVTAEPPNSVLILTLMQGARFTKEAFDRMKQVATYNRPHVRRSAIVGAESLPQVWYNALRSFTQREFPTFATEEEAKNWLVSDQGAPAATPPEAPAATALARRPAIFSLPAPARFLLLVIALNLCRYLIGFPLERLFLPKTLFAEMQRHADFFNTAFTTADWVTSYFYNFMMWLACELVFVLMRPALGGSAMLKSFKVYALMWLFFASLSAVYMNHYRVARMFYLYNLLDAVLAFAIVATANGWLYPIFFRSRE